MDSYYIKPPEPTLNGTDIWADDVLERQKVAEKFTNLLKSIQGSCVISINSPYGSGKSFFLRRWQRSLDDDFVSLYFDAWNTDFYEHAFIPFVSSVIQQMRANSIMGKDDSLLNKLENVGGKIGSSIALNLVSKATLELIKPEDIKESLESLQNYENTKYFENYKERVKNLDEFKDILSELVHELKQKSQKLIVFIDELERCRPNFAVELLETIKHLFEVSGIIFVLATDRSQLEHTVKNLYGSGMNADGYLRRFIDIELKLPEPKIEKYIEYLYETHKLYEVVRKGDDFYAGGKTLIQYMSVSSRMFNLSLREIAQCFAEINVTIRILGQAIFLPILLSLLVCLRCRNEPLYYELGTITAQRAIDEFHKLAKQLKVEERSIQVFKLFLCTCSDTEELNYISNKFNQLNSSISDAAKRTDGEFNFISRCKEIRDSLIYSHHFDRNTNIILSLKKVLEFNP